MSEYKDGRLLLSSSTAETFFQKLNQPSQEVIAYRNSFLNDINENVTFIQSDANQVIANIVDFDDSFLDMADDQTTTWSFSANIPLNSFYSVERIFSFIDSPHTMNISFPPSSDKKTYFFTSSEPYHQSCA